MWTLRLVFAGLLVLQPASASAQAQPRPPKTCNAINWVLSLRLVDAQGHGIADAAIEVRRLRDGSRLPDAGPMGGQGDYKLLESGELEDLAPGGEVFEVRFQRKEGSRKRHVRIGLDERGCHPKLLDPPGPVRW